MVLSASSLENMFSGSKNQHLASAPPPEPATALYHNSPSLPMPPGNHGMVPAHSYFAQAPQFLPSPAQLSPNYAWSNYSTYNMWQPQGTQFSSVFQPNQNPLENLHSMTRNQPSPSVNRSDSSYDSLPRSFNSSVASPESAKTVPAAFFPSHVRTKEEALASSACSFSPAPEDVKLPSENSRISGPNFCPAAVSLTSSEGVSGAYRTSTTTLGNAISSTELTGPGFQRPELSANDLIIRAPSYFPSTSTAEFSWLKPTRPSGPGTNNVRVRTRDKYRMVYSDFQRVELEKEFHTTRYINSLRKTELSRHLGLTERQIKIWFQNRRAKERKSNRKDSISSENADTKDIDDSRRVTVKTECTSSTTTKEPETTCAAHPPPPPNTFLLPTASLSLMSPHLHQNSSLYQSLPSNGAFTVTSTNHISH